MEMAQDHVQWCVVTLAGLNLHISLPLCQIIKYE